MSTIREITEFENEALTGETWQHFDGWRIVADDQTVVVGISNSQDCCEEFGYFNSDDDPLKYIGAELLRVERVSEDKSERLVTTIPDVEYGLDAGAAVFVNIVTDRGAFQLAAYNAHNGYYGHEAVVISRDLNVSEIV